MTIRFAALVPYPTSESAQNTSSQLDRANRLRRAGWTLKDLGGAYFLASNATAFNGSGQVVACGNVRLDNADRLQLLRTPTDGKCTASHLDLIAALYDAKGASALKGLRGSFSVVLWQPERRALTAVRDQLGVMPLYLIKGGAAMVISNDMRLAAHLSARDLKLNVHFVTGYIAGFVEDRETTVFDGVTRIAPGHVFSLKQGKEATAEAYWSLELPDPMKTEEAPARLAETLETAVARRMAGPLNETGFMLSGGLDSSSLATVGAKLHPHEQVRTVSLLHGKDKHYDESTFIDLVNKKIGANPLSIDIEGPPSIAAMEELVEEQFDLCPAPGLLKSRRIYSAAAENGLSCLLDGHGGDEVVSHGYRRLAELAEAGRYATLANEIRGAARIFGEPVLEQYVRFLHTFAPWPPRSLRRRVAGRILRSFDRSSPERIDPLDVVLPSIRERHHLEERRDKIMQAHKQYRSKPDERQDHFATMNDPLVSRAFEVLHRSASHNGICPEYPFYDLDVVETCLAAPSDAKFRGGFSRRFLRDAMDGLLPNEVCWRVDKANFTTEVRESILDYLDDKKRQENIETRVSDFVDIDAFRGYVDLIRSAPIQDSARAVQIVWRCVYLGFFLEKLLVWQDLQRRGSLC